MNTILLYQNKPSEGREFEFLRYCGVEKALRQCQDAGYRALFVPELADTRIASPQEARVWNNWYTWYTTPSLRATGRSKGNKPVVIYAHVPHYFSNPDNLAQAVKQGLVNYAGRMPNPEFKRLLGLEDNENVFVVDHKKLKRSPSGIIDVEQALEHPQTIPFLGGSARAEQYLQQHKKVKGNEIGVWHTDDLADEPLGRLLFLGVHYDALSGSDDLGSGDRFVGVAASEAPKARAARKSNNLRENTAAPKSELEVVLGEFGMDDPAELRKAMELYAAARNLKI